MGWFVWVYNLLSDLIIYLRAGEGRKAVFINGTWQGVKGGIVLEVPAGCCLK